MERNRKLLRKEIINTVYGGTIIFRGLKKDIYSEGKDLVDGIKNIANEYLPKLFPKFEIGAKKVTGKEPEKILTAANLEGLPKVFYEGSDCLNLIIKSEGRYTINKDADIVGEIFGYIKEKHETDTSVDGKSLENHFGGIGYGWDRDVLRVVIATLFRAGDIEVFYKGSRYKNYLESTAREAIINNNAFKIATFIPRSVSITPKDRRDACKNLENIICREIEPDVNIISEELKKILVDRKEVLLELKGSIGAYDLPAKNFILEILDTIDNLRKQDNEDCVEFLAHKGKEFTSDLDKVKKIKSSVTGHNLEIIKNAKKVLSQVVPHLRQETDEDKALKQSMDSLREIINSEDFYDRLPAISKKTEEIMSVYDELYKQKHKSRYDLYSKLKEKIKGFGEWGNLPEEFRKEIINEIDLKCCYSVNFNDLFKCSKCNSSIGEIDLDIRSRSTEESKILKKIDNIRSTIDKKIQKVRISEYLPREVKDLDDFKKRLDNFSQEVGSLLEEGKEVIIDWE